MKNSATLRAVVLLALLLCMATNRANAELLTFELTPAGVVPIDDQPLTAAYAILGGTGRMFFDVNGNNTFDPGTDINPSFEQIGEEEFNGFRSTFNEAFDTARPGFQAQLGSFFLRHPNDFVDVRAQPFIIDYDTTSTIAALSGEIWDIDNAGSNTERWRVEVLNGSGGLLASQLSPLGINQFNEASLDSLPWAFQFTDLPAGVDKLRITFEGSKVTGLGFAFNNFSPDVAVPEPPAGLLIAIGVAALVGYRRVRLLTRA